MLSKTSNFGLGESFHDPRTQGENAARFFGCPVRLSCACVRACVRFFNWIIEIWALQKYENLVDLEKSCKNDYLVAIVAVHTAENEPSKVWSFVVKSEKSSISNLSTKVALVKAKHALKDAPLSVVVENLVERYGTVSFSDFQPNHQTLEGSFSAVSAPIFAIK